MKREKERISSKKEKTEQLKMKERFQRSLQRDERGITLVALVITIVILIILAVVTINFAFGDNGLIKQAESARDYQANADATDSKLLNDATEYIDGIIGGNGSEEDNSGETTKSEVEEAKESGETFEDTTTIKDDLENDVTIPGGFHVAEDSGTKVEEGIVIEDDAGNQFVWIPVGEYNVSTSINAEGKLTNNLSRRTFTESGATEINGDDAIDSFYGEGNANSVAKDQIEGFKTSATTNGGYYIGRYEAGTEIERTSAGDSLTTPLVQANKNAYVWVTRDQAKTQAEAMYSGNSYVTSELISSYAWDTALNFICQTNEEGYLLAITTDSAYGNIRTNTKELTGVYEADKYSNIHDFLGNSYEWTTEYSSGSNGTCVDRGGYYFSNTSYSAAYRYADPTTNIDSVGSFRLQLYVK